jgi:glycosyltransferase involved in cell wall biosynthesis
LSGRSVAEGETPPETSRPSRDWVRVTFVSAYAEIGGGEVHLESLLGRLDPEWINAVILLEDGKFAKHLAARGFPVKVLEAPGRRGLLTGALLLRRELRRDPPQLVHANGAKAALVSALAAIGTGVPVLWNKIDAVLDGIRARIVARGCAQVVGISGTTVATFRGKTRQKVHVVHPGLPDYRVDPAEGRTLVRDVLAIDDDAQVVVLSGRLCPPKGQLDLIEALPSILELRPRTRVAFLGGESRAYPGFDDFLRRRAGELGVAGAVAFLGHRSPAITSVADAVRFVSGCDVLVAPSRTEKGSGWAEGFGLAAVEAMRVGTPVVAYRHGSLPEVLGECALIVPEGDRRSLGEALVTVLSDRRLAARLAACGYERSQRYRLDASVVEMRTRYRSSATTVSEDAA